MTAKATLHRIAIAAATALVSGMLATPLHAIETDSPAPPPEPNVKLNTQQQQQKTAPQPKKKPHRQTKKKTKQESDAEFLREYRAARALMLAQDYRAGIVAMHAIGHDEHPDIANYIGYAYRRLGDYDRSKLWYERALAADPNHVRTWSYYGMWQMEQGNRLKALEDLQKVASICGNTSCRAYTELKAVIDGTATY
jgi:tetratricopeptide (TPR) repeat protein